ncbi:aminoglycoside phosphotransferase family protein [Bacteriovorax sp. PP10]|uniref:Aminoglycoside phosphotransferase family protein n=1 Tax=Bacteriovorax antarcticus TaxID=3088717 RepID=A0ABU5VVC6_9BACT|nr:aminoglycoside phosphotransferase family protein [Bacteriovorax sp. PP10]MEA9357010.1 aminoglycoside phosphotransferase family protein [Bacteriovorax sp. PP10]
MRTHNHLEIKKLCEQSIAPLMNKYNLGEVKNIKMDTEGWVNPCFFVNQSFVFRFNARDPQLPKYQREFFVFNLLKKSDIPVPQIVYLDDSKEHIGFDVLITEMLPGTNIESDWKNLSIDQRIKVSEEAGKNLFKLNQHLFDFFGELSSSGPLPRTKTWPDYLKAKLSFHLNEAMNLKIIDESVEANIWKIFETHFLELSLVTSSNLVHVDYHLGNLLHHNLKVTAVLDFEWAFAGDPLYDFCRWRSHEEDLANSRDAFLKGYKKTEFSTSELKRMDIYQMIRNIELCSVAKLHFSENEAEEYLSITIQQINKLSVS